jgi:hypothetical protein
LKFVLNWSLASFKVVLELLLSSSSGDSNWSRGLSHHG